MSAPANETIRGTRGRRNIVPLVALVLWFGTVIVSYLISVSTGVRIQICLFKRLTGAPCATCGGTRSAVALLGLDPATAWFMNPLVTVLLVLLPIWAIWRFTIGRGYQLPLSARRSLLVIGLVALAANWIYVIRYQKEIDARPLPRFERFFGGNEPSQAPALP